MAITLNRIVSAMFSKAWRISTASAVIFILLTCSCKRGERTFTSEGVTDTLIYARGISITRFEGYIQADVRSPWDTMKLMHRYILVDRNLSLPEGLPGGLPEGPPEGTIIRVPVERAAVYSSVHASMMEQIGVADRIIGICDSAYITSREIASRIRSGKTADLGLSTAPDTEKIVDLETEIIIASPFENAGYGSAEKLGIPIVEAADYTENHPLGRTEWVRFFGLLFGCTDTADSLFHSTEEKYNRLKALASKTENRPTVLLEKRYGGAWFIPSGQSYAAMLHKDAGADYIFDDYAEGNNVPMPYEKVFDTAGDADYWFFKYDAKQNFTMKELENEYPPYANFKPFKDSAIYGCNTLLTSYYDDITLHPDMILADLIHIYHPSLLPDYRNRYYFRLER